MRNTLLGTTAILMASIAVASAQTLPNEHSNGAMPQKQERQHGADRLQKQDRQNEGRRQAQTPNDSKQRMQEHAQDRSRDRANDNRRDENKQQESKQSKSQDRVHERANKSDSRHGQAQERTSGKADRTADHGSRDRATKRGQMDRQDMERRGQDQHRDQHRQADRQRGDRARAESTVKLTTEQRTRIRRDVLEHHNVPRVGNVNFSINVGVAVPQRVNVVAVPTTLIDVHPEWRGYSYFVANDEIIIVNRNRHIVDVVVLGPTDAALAPSGAVVDLAPADIREVQLVLIRRGYDIEADGVLGPNTRQALVQFQRRNDLNPSGDINRRTVAALGVDIRAFN